jgi:uncharacterized protein (TIGR02646 family)
VIRRDRASVQPPRAFLTRAKKALGELRSFYRIEKRDRSQRRAKTDPWLLTDKALRHALSKLFEGKCAYCETLVTEADVDRFRPPQEAMDLDGRVEDPDLYWWLAYDWENLYPACGECITAKATRFPVRGRRAEPEARGPVLDEERRLLLDPCRDEPEKELRFARDGTVTGTTERGAISIEVFALNRRELVDARRSAAEQLLKALVTMSGAQAAKARNRLAPTEAAFTGLLRQLVDEHAGVSPGPKREGLVSAERGSVWLERIDLENFRTLRRATLEFSEHGPEYAPWLMLLGVNGVGKSSVLEAIALAFMSPGDRQRYVPDAGRLVNRNSRTPDGSVRLMFSDGSETALRFRRGVGQFVQEGKPPPLNVYAYGSTRLPPAPGSPRDDRPREVRLNNLFDPRYPLTLGEEWLSDVRRVPAKRFNFLASALRGLLELEDDDRLVRSKGVLAIRQHGNTLPVAEHSDGYRSVIAFVTDLMLNLSARWDSMRSAEGLVLIDELEVHLHPTWRMAVVGRLREVFPRLRFIITTHDPLSLRGALPGEVHVLRRDPDTHEVVVAQRDIPPGLTADGLLTGSWFGMATTLDDDTIGLMQEHSSLLVQRQTSDVVRRRREIENVLRHRRGAFAENDDERLVRSVVAELRAEKPPLTDEEKSLAKEAVLDLARSKQPRRRATRPRQTRGRGAR